MDSFNKQLGLGELLRVIELGLTEELSKRTKEPLRKEELGLVSLFIQESFKDPVEITEELIKHNTDWLREVAGNVIRVREVFRKRGGEGVKEHWELDGGENKVLEEYWAAYEGREVTKGTTTTGYYLGAELEDGRDVRAYARQLTLKDNKSYFTAGAGTKRLPLNWKEVYYISVINRAVRKTPLFSNNGDGTFKRLDHLKD